MRSRQLLWVAIIGAGMLAPAAGADDIGSYLDEIARVGPEGKGSVAARLARDSLVRHGIEIAPRLLDALDTTNIVAANWYRSVFDEIVAREFDRPVPRWPVEDFRKYVSGGRHPGRSRRLVLNLLDRIDPAFRERFLPEQLDDSEFRNDAVAWTLREGDRFRQQNQLDQARGHYRLAFAHARESDQVLLAARNLNELGDVVDPIQHMGFITRWYLLGPFDAPGTSGFDLSFPPEAGVELDGTYPGKDQRSLKWKPSVTKDPLGQVNLIEALAGVREAVGYAYAEIESPRDQSVELRCSADDNLTVWLNGNRVLAQRQWLNGTRLDRFVARVDLDRGDNRLLVKICQGPQHVNPEVPNNWSFQLRFCDATGASVGCRVRKPE